ncbi:MAG TPA: DUF1631 family protein [Paucimonas sp.]|nr:DUF1631 family protein [Paucimonas sp.]
MSAPANLPQVTVPALSEAQRAELLTELIDVGLTVANAQIDSLTARLVDALQRAASQAGDLKEAELRAKAATLLRQNRYPFHYLLTERLRTAVAHEMRATRHPEFVHSELQETPPALPPELEVDKKICLIKLARALESEQADRLNALNARLAFLTGRETIETAHNPFRPLVFLSVLHDAWCEFQPEAATHPMLYRLLQPSLCIEMAPIYYALNTALIKRGVLAGIEEAAILTRPGPAPVADEAAAAPPPPAAKTTAAGTQERPVADDPVQQQLRRLFPASRPVLSQSPRPAAANGFPTLFDEDFLQEKADRNGMLDYLEQVQEKSALQLMPVAGQAVPVEEPAQLAQIKREAPSGTWTQTDGHALDLVIRIFSVLLRDRDIAPDMKTLIGGLQLPVLHAAIADKDFFFKEDHPARRTVELLSRLAAAWDRRSGADDPLYQTILRNVKRIQSDRRPAVFAQAVADIETFLAKEERETTAVLSAPIAQALKQEKHLQAVKAAKHEVALRIGTGEVVAFVETFLEDKWVTVLTIAYGVKEEKPRILDSAIKTMDELVWSVKPKITREERNELVGKLPGIIAKLNKWLDAIKWNDAERVKFFDELARCHASIVRAPVELSPERQLQLALKIAKKAAERRQQREASRPPEPASDQFDEQVRNLACGAWVEFRQKSGISLKVRLAWISPMRSYYLFATRARQEAFSLSDEELTQALREKRAHVLLPAGVVGRALTEALAPRAANNGALAA